MTDITDSDIELIMCLCLEMSDRAKSILKIFPHDKKEEMVLKHLTAAMIHINFFMHDICNHIGLTNIKIADELKNKFLEECGCKGKQ